MATSLSLPTAEEADAVDEKLGSALSSVDAFTMRVEAIHGSALEAEEALRMIRDEIPFPEQPEFEFDAGTFARLLVYLAHRP